METVLDTRLIDKNILDSYAAVDIGNSRLKILFEDTYETFFYDSNFTNSLNNFLLNFSENEKIFAISSVNSIIFDEFLKIIANFKKFRYILISSLLDEQTLVDFSQVSGTGEDRKLGIIGGLLYSNPPFVTVDVGTAITINILNENNIFEGGIIMPGPITQMSALNQSTTGLKDYRIEIPNAIIGKNTADAINSGIINGSSGSILFFLDYIKNNIISIEDFPVFVTGGSATMISNNLQNYKSNIIYTPFLVLFGILFLLMNNKF
jgi:type III pantothenate kinase